jgi:hypothetical protein
LPETKYKIKETETREKEWYQIEPKCIFCNQKVTNWNKGSEMGKQRTLNLRYFPLWTVY